MRASFTARQRRTAGERWARGRPIMTVRLSVVLGSDLAIVFKSIADCLAALNLFSLERRPRFDTWR
jgi:hypothetical protein